MNKIIVVAGLIVLVGGLLPMWVAWNGCVGIMPGFYSGVLCLSLVATAVLLSCLVKRR